MRKTRKNKRKKRNVVAPFVMGVMINVTAGLVLILIQKLLQ
ncbi:hypothetical protein GCM10008018_36420 [Paenibacillus marchantiophytorum]|uniref:DUF4044 domain-containing protein n=1 Tax=Paenibacillus marchantiophytorum TaxID=1619310 RepID=A0ABQ1ETT0_9BACL|nr:hypothetical protein [Paenibacillus marchantiophytorum]GFZ86986.1 hypothetical protein GCM10008018_36420 [Paenibacillus marchantiophytorum]